MKEITSAENPIVKNLAKLGTRKYREAFSMCIIDGEKIVRENKENIQTVFVKAGAKKDYSDILKGGAEPISLASKIFNNIASFETDIIATATIPKLGCAVSFPFLVLDRVQDPGNLGTILRTAAAFGFCTVFLINCADPWSQKAIRSAMGAQFKLSIHQNFEMPSDSVLYIADMDGANVSNIAPFGKWGLVLGNEGQGISADLKKLPHIIVTIPMQNVDSLNVGVAAGIIMHSLLKL